MESPYKKKHIKKHIPRPFKKMMQNSNLDQSKPMDIDKIDENDKMDIDSN
jgi:hypothetical protein